MRDRILSRRSFLQAVSVSSLGGLTGCSLIAGGEKGAINLYVYNNTSTELTATLHYLTCDQVGDEQQSIGVESNTYAYSANNVVEDSGACELEVTVPDGPSGTYEWDVDQKTLVITIAENDIGFSLHSATYTPEE